MPITTKLGATALTVGALAALPGTALAQRGHHDRSGDVPSRIATKLTKAEKALDRAQERADDGNTSGAASQLAAVRRNLASAQKAALKRDDEDADAAVAELEHELITGTAGMFDGVTDGDLVSAIDTTLDAAIDARDALIAARGADSDVAGEIDADADDEVDNVTDAISDDELTAGARSDLEDALTALKATAASVTAAAAGSR